MEAPNLFHQGRELCIGGFKNHDIKIILRLLDSLSLFKFKTIIKEEAIKFVKLFFMFWIQYIYIFSYDHLPYFFIA